MTKQDVASIREVYDITRRLEDKLDHLSVVMASKEELRDVKIDLSKVHDDVESLKKWRYYFTGVAAAVGAIISYLADKIKL